MNQPLRVQRIVGFSLLLAMGLLTGCNLPAPVEPTTDAMATAAAGTVSARLTQPPTSTPLPVIDTPPPSPLPTATEVQPTATPPLTPTSTPDKAVCENKVEFVVDVTIDDDTSFSPGTTFTKTWRLRNVGTCSWTSNYALVFVEGSKMGAVDAVPLTGSVAPQATVDLSVKLTAPDESGTYQGDWMLRDPQGDRFGIGANADESFWVRIVVSEISDELGLGEPTWRDSFASGANWYLVSTDDTIFKVEDGQMVLEAINTGTIDEWGLSSRPKLRNFYLEVIAKTGASCSGLDRYGVLVRAPDSSQGYVYGFSCGGSFRIYKWDGETYTGLKAWTSSPYILAGPNQTNRLGIRVEGDKFKLYANGNMMAEVSDSTYDEGRIGLFIGSQNTENFKVFLDEVAYWVLED